MRLGVRFFWDFGGGIVKDFFYIPIINSEREFLSGDIMIFGSNQYGLGKTSALLEKGIQASTIRRQLIANNIANVDTSVT